MTRWQDDQYARMAYSFVPVGCSGSAYDVLAESVGEKVHFAGEVRNDPIPVSGFLSGMYAETYPLVLWTGKTKCGRVFICVDG